MRSNKWNISWQVARVRAKKIKDIQMRVDFMHEWLLIHNYRVNIDRIANWLRMSMMSANYESTIIYKKALYKLLEVRDLEEGDLPNDVKAYARDPIIEDVLKDLEQRTYSFQFKKLPPGHYEFIKRIKDVLGPNQTIN